MKKSILGLIALLSSLVKVKGISFVSIRGYVSKGSNDTEQQNVLININVPYGVAKEKDVETLKNTDVKQFKAETNTDLGISVLEEARKALIGALISPAKTLSEAQINTYEKINDWLKVHKETGQAYIFGMKVRKTVTVEGEVRKDTRRELTKAKDLFRSKVMKSSQYRMYIVDRLDNVKANGDTIEF